MCQYNAFLLPQIETEKKVFFIHSVATRRSIVPIYIYLTHILYTFFASNLQTVTILKYTSHDLLVFYFILFLYRPTFVGRGNLSQVHWHTSNEWFILVHNYRGSYTCKWFLAVVRYIKFRYRSQIWRGKSGGSRFIVKFV